MKPRSLIILSISLAGCSAMPKTVNISWERKPLEQIGVQCVSHSAYGCSSYDKENSWCRISTPTRVELAEIIAKDSKLKGMSPEGLEWLILGHETKHCFEGQFHK
jgi:hypothetical protein